MHTTGIVRRIDELGRVVIPKEIRRTLKIREGEELEIFTDENNTLVLKKYSAVKSLIDFAEEYAKAINSTTGHTVLIADKDNYAYAAGALGKEFKSKPISRAVEQIIMDRKKEIRNGGDFIKLLTDDDTPYKGQLIASIIVGGDVFGAIVVFSTTMEMSEADVKLLDTAKAFLEQQL
ncbi:MAG: stage V sporulation T C-terminal domain-containing protein [Christensenellales bacterium]|jgi:AbrB family transcriptional regulator (stage V sporulation protein T)